MKEIKEQLSRLKAELVIKGVGFSIASLMVFVAAINSLILHPEQWWVSLALFLMATLFGLFTYFLCRYLKKKVDRMEKEVAEAEKLMGDEDVEEDD